MINISINGHPVQAREDATILEAARNEGIYIPSLCEFRGLENTGCCRVCLVEIEGSPKLAAACSTPVAEGMSVLANTPKAVETRRVMVELMLARHPLECTTCTSHGDCVLARLCMELNIKESRFAARHDEIHRYPIDDANPFIIRDRNKCVLCGRCVRACGSFAQYHAVDFQNRSGDAIVDVSPDGSLDQSDCVFCGQCVAVCPVGALAAKPAIRGGVQWKAETVKTVCPYCGVGCELDMKVDRAADRIIDITGNHMSQTGLNKGRTCVKGRFAWGFVHSEDRLTEPLIRENGVFRKAAWDEALEKIAGGLSNTAKNHGPNSVGFFSSARCTNEENYLMQRLAREVVGTNNVDHCAHL